jgi:hypothetical protein
LITAPLISLLPQFSACLLASKNHNEQIEVAAWLLNQASYFSVLPEINCYTKLLACLCYVFS